MTSSCFRNSARFKLIHTISFSCVAGYLIDVTGDAAIPFLVFGLVQACGGLVGFIVYFMVRQQNRKHELEDRNQNLAQKSWKKRAVPFKREPTEQNQRKRWSNKWCVWCNWNRLKWTHNNMATTKRDLIFGRHIKIIKIDRAINGNTRLTHMCLYYHTWGECN